MKSSEKEKMCINCEGRIPFTAEVCPYCASHQLGAGLQNSFQAPIFQHQSLEDSLTSLYTPPYQGKRPQFGQDTSPAPEPFIEKTSMYKEVKGKPDMNPLLGPTVEEETLSKKGSFFPISLLFAGAQFSILGLMQLLFSKNGILQLQWDASYWFYYCLIGIPLFYFGLKKTRVLD